jgi:ABC-2 type transport system permease protein
MKSKASYFSISKPLILENLRRFWAIPALSFLVYFLSGVFPILMTYSHLNDLSNYIKISLSNQQPFYMLAHLIFPVIAAVVIFRYLQSISSVSVMHSMPFTRSKLYNSGFVSGLLLILPPILINGIILLAISKPVYNVYGTETGMMTSKINLFGRADILNWIWVSIVIAVVIYAVSIFAGIVTGNSLMHFATAIWFNFLIPGLYGIFIAYFSHFLYGFDSSGNWVEFGMRLSPFLNVLQNQAHLGIYSTIGYLISILVLYGITNFLYQKRKLEHATDTLAFGFMEPIICYLITFPGMTMLGFYFQVLGEAEFYMYAGLAAGTLIFFIIGRMIVKKTPRIYNRKSLKSLGIYALLAVLFIAGLNLDFTGFEKRVPDAGKVKNLVIFEGFDNGYRMSQYMDNSGINRNNAHLNLKLKDQANIKAATALHQKLIENKNQFKISTKNTYTSGIFLEYNQGSVLPLTRRYMVDYDFYKNSPELKQIYESKEFKDYYTPSNLNMISLEGIYVNGAVPYAETVEIKNKNDLTEFMTCLNKDFKAQSFEDMISLKHGYANVSISFSYKNKNSETPEKMIKDNAQYKITEEYTNTIKWLNDHGYTDRFQPNVNNIAYIEVLHYTEAENGKPESAVFDGQGTSEVSSVSSKVLKITDPQQMQKLLDGYETQTTSYNDYYYGNIIYKGGIQGQNYTHPADAKEMADKYATDAASMSTQIYFNKGNIPDFVLDYFK